MNIECEKKKMFGYSVGFINGNMVAGIFADRIFFRVRIEEQDRVKEKTPLIKDFEPVTGRKMKDYFEIVGTKDNKEIIKEYIKKAEKTTNQLPVKINKKK
jgi:TfoX/Sxy family transcriptional regulator of competence genes